MTDHLLLEQDGAVAVVTFNRPEARNAMTFEMYEALHDACERLDRDPGVRAVVLRGARARSFARCTRPRRFPGGHATSPARSPSTRHSRWPPPRRRRDASSPPSPRGVSRTLSSPAT